MAEELLDASHVRPAFEQMRGVAVAQGVRADRAGQSRQFGQLVYDALGLAALQARAPDADEQSPLPGVLGHGLALGDPGRKAFFRRPGQGAEALLAALAENPDDLGPRIHIVHVEPEGFAHAQARAVEQLGQGQVTQALGIGLDFGLDEREHLVHVQGLGLAALGLGVVHPSHGIDRDQVLTQQELEQAAQGGELAAHGRLFEALAVQAGEIAAHVVLGQLGRARQARALGREMGLELGQILAVGRKSGLAAALLGRQIAEEGRGRIRQADRFLPGADRGHRSFSPFPWPSSSGLLQWPRPGRSA